MKRLIDALYDRAMGYAFLCWIFQRPVLVWPRQFSWLLDAFFADNDVLELYLKSVGLPYDRSRIGRESADVGPQSALGRFSEIAEFNRNRDLR